MNKTKPKVMVIGLDGATFTNLKPWMEEGILPNLKFLVENGASGKLKSTVPCLSSLAWTSFMTGVNPGKHGVFGFVKPFKDKTYKKELFSSRDIKAKTIFEILSDYGNVSGAVNIPMTYPSFKINGFMITCGLTTPGTDVNFTYPEDLFERAGLRKSEYVLNVNSRDYCAEEKEKFFLDLIKCTEKRKEVSFKLMDRYDWDFFTIVFGGTDWIQHFFWHLIDPKHIEYNQDEAERFLPLIKRCYQKLDSIVGEFINRMDKNTSLFIISDHGFGPWRKTISLQNLLRQNSLFCYKDESFLSRSSGIHGKIRKFLHQNSALYRKAKAMIKPAACKLSKKPGKEKMPEDKIKMRFGFGLNERYWQNIDWQRTVAYAGYTNNTVYLNLKDREPGGIIDSNGEYEQTRDKIIDIISNLREPDSGDKLKVKIYKKEKIYSGPYSQAGYDLCFEVENGGYVLRSHAFAKDIFSENPGWTGTHTRDGIVIAYGGNLKKTHCIKNARIMDIAPTALYLLGVPVPDDMDGEMLKDVINDDYLRQTPVKHQKFSERDEEIKPRRDIGHKEDMAKVEKRLADLGYI